MEIMEIIERVRKNDPTVTEIRSRDRIVRSLSFMNGNTHVTKLVLNYNYIDNVDALTNNSTLTELHLYDNSLKYTDLTPLGTMQSLIILDIAYSKVKDISFMRGNASIEVLCVGYSNISDLSPLEHNETLKKLNLCHNEIEDLTPLSTVKSVVYLNLSQNKIKDVRPIQGKSYGRLDLSSNPDITDVSSLGESDIVSFDIRGTKVTRLNGLYGNTSILRIYFAGTPVRLSDISQIDVMCRTNNMNRYSRTISYHDLILNKNIIYTIRMVYISPLLRIGIEF